MRILLKKIENNINFYLVLKFLENYPALATNEIKSARLELIDLCKNP